MKKIHHGIYIFGYVYVIVYVYAYQYCRDKGLTHILGLRLGREPGQSEDERMAMNSSVLGSNE